MSHFESDIKIVCVESKAFEALVDKVVTQMKEQFFGNLNPWINEKEAMDLLKITSKVTFKKYRDEGGIESSYMSTKHILYKRQSILDFIESKSNQ